MTVLLPSIGDEPEWLAESDRSSTKTNTWLHVAWEQQLLLQRFKAALKSAECGIDRPTQASRWLP